MKKIWIHTGEAAKAKILISLQLSKPWMTIILNLAVSFGTPCSKYDKCLPSRSFILGDVIGGPFGDPHIFGGGGRNALKAHAKNPIKKISSNFLKIPNFP